MRLKKLLSLTIAVIMSVSGITFTANAEEGVKLTGNCGNKATWTLSDDGTLTILGEGEVTSASGWNAYVDSVKKAVVGEGITLLASGTLSYCKNIEYIELPSTLERFNNCLNNEKNLPLLKNIWVYSQNITEQSIHSNVGNYPSAGSGVKWHLYKGSETEELLRKETETDSGKEYQCLGLKDEDIEYIKGDRPEVTAPEPKVLPAVTDTSGPCGFDCEYNYDKKTKTLTFSGTGAITISQNYIKHSDATEHIVINSGITSINTTTAVIDTNSGAFYKFPILNDVKLPDTLIEIGNYSFYDTPLTNIIDGLPSNLETIGINAFTSSKISDISFPESLKTVGERAFLGTNIKSINLHEGMTIGGAAFSNCNSLVEVTVPQKVLFGMSTIGGMGMARPPAIFSGCKGIEKIIIEDGCRIFDGFGNIMDENGVAANICYDCTSLKVVVVKGNIDYIGGSAFNKCPSLTDIYFYNSKLSTISETTFGNGNDNADKSIDTSNNPTYHVISNSVTKSTLNKSGYLKDATEETEANYVYLPDLTALETAITDAEAIDTSKYTDETVSALTTSIENGKAVLENLDATQDDIDKAAQAINEAKTALAEKPDDPSPTDPTDKPSAPSNSNPTNPKPTTTTPNKVTPPTVTSTVVKPAKVKNVKVTAKKKKLNVSWKKVSGATGYEVQYATNNKFTKNKKSVTLKKNKITIKKLKAKKKYFVKVRAYKLANGNKYLGNWSKVVKKKTK